MSTSVKARCAGDPRSWWLTQPYRTLDMATAEYVVANANQRAGSGTFQTTRIMRPMMFQTCAAVMAQAGPRKRSDAKHISKV